MIAATLGGIALIWLTSGRNKSGGPTFQVPELDIPQAMAFLDAGAIAVDVRDQEKFAYRHLPNAILVPLVVLRAAIPASLAAAKAAPILVYCNRGLAHGPEAAHLLMAAGFTQVFNLNAGIEGWADAGMRVEHG